MANEKYLLKIDTYEFRFQEEKEIGNCKYSLERLSYDKGIYRPAEMLVTMKVGGTPTHDDLVKTFHQKSVSLQIKIDDKDAKKDKNDNNTEKKADAYKDVAQNYFVFKVKPFYQKVANGASVKLELTIYSEDKLMTLDKYSKAWSGKKLGKDIFNKEVQKFKTDNSNINASLNLNVIQYSTTEGKEFIQPYLVQYNESFYDFLRRTANRCGEFLYHENGALHLGMEVLDAHKDIDYAPMASDRHYEDIMSAGTNTSDYGYNYLKDRKDPGAKPYSEPLTYDDYLDKTSKEYTSYGEQMGLLDKNSVSCVCMLLGATSLTQFATNMTMTYGYKCANVPIAMVSLESFYRKVNVDGWDGKGEQKSADDNYISQFSTYDDQELKLHDDPLNLNAKFYSVVRQAEKKVSEDAVYLEFGNQTKNLHIGDQILVDGDTYLVIGVNGSCKLNGLLYEEQQQVIAVKPYGDANLIIPPFLPGEAVRESQSQLAFVTANFDPEKIGRVRVRFAWQPKEGEGSDASPWIRVSLPFATDGGGVKFKPNVDDEVMVSFEEGNMERPYVSGYLLSPRSNDSWSYLSDRTITSKNGHNITFNDGVNGGTFYFGLLPGLKAIRSFLPNNIIPNLLDDNAKCRDLTGGMTISDRYGLYKIDLSSDSRSVMIQSAMGDVSLNAFTGINISAPNGDIKIQGKNVSIEASDTVSIESGLAIKNRYLPSAAKYEEDGYSWAGAHFRAIPTDIWNGLRGAFPRALDKVVDVRLLRTVADMFLRPIDGTTKIKSYTFVRVEAGNGSAEVPHDAREGMDDETNAIVSIVAAIQMAASTAGSRIELIKTCYVEFQKAAETFNNQTNLEGVNANEEVIDFGQIKGKGWTSGVVDPESLQYTWSEYLAIDDEDQDEDEKKEDDQQKDDDQKEEKKNDKEQNQGIKEDNSFMIEGEIEDILNKSIDGQKDQKLRDRQSIINAATNLLTTIHNLYLAIDNYSQDNIDFGEAGAPSYAKYVKEAIKKQKFSAVSSTDVTKEPGNKEWGNIKTNYKRKAVKTLLADTNIGKTAKNYNLSIGNPGDNDNLDNNDNWSDMVGKLIAASDGEQKTKTLKHRFQDSYVQPWIDSTVNRRRWKVGVKGKILLSDNPAETITFNKDGEPNHSWNLVGTEVSAAKLKAKLLSID